MKAAATVAAATVAAATAAKLLDRLRGVNALGFRV